MATERQPTHANISDYSYSPFYPITIKLLLQGVCAIENSYTGVVQKAST